MREVKRKFSRPVRLPWKPPAKPMGHDTRLLRTTFPLSGSSAPPMIRIPSDAFARARLRDAVRFIGGLLADAGENRAHDTAHPEESCVPHTTTVRESIKSSGVTCGKVKSALLPLTALIHLVSVA